MKAQRRFCFAIMVLVGCLPVAASDPLILYSTGFEPGEGYDEALTLVGQQGWLGSLPADCSGNGLLDEPPNQQAYVGFFPLCPGKSALTIWRPLDFSPLAAGKPIVTFAVRMAIIDSENRRYDCFRWSVYSTNDQPLFTIDFDNSDLTVNYLLENGTNFVFTGRRFTNDVTMDLEIEMDFSRNRWRAMLDGSVLATNQPITQGNTSLHLSDISAVWLYRDPSAPGDNFMLFDNYFVIAEGPPRLTAIGPVGGRFLLHLEGERGRNYVIETSTNLTQWTAIKTNNAADGSFDFLDTGSASQSHRFYRARLVP